MEFKKLSDVEVVAEPTESANVLIEENGVIKKAPKTAVGGAGGSEPDMVVSLSQYPAEKPKEYAFSIAEGSVENALNAFREQRVPKVKIRFLKEVEAGVGSYAYKCSAETDAMISLYGEEMTISYLAPYNGGLHYGYIAIDFNGNFIDSAWWRPDNNKEIV